MFTASDIFLGGILPATVAAVVMLAARRFRLRPSTAWPVSLAAGCVTGQLGLAAQAGIDQAIGNVLRPRVAHDWLPLLIVGAAAVGIVASVGRQRIAGGLSVAVCAAAPTLFLWKSVYVQNEWSRLESAAWLSLLSIALLVIWRLLAGAPADSQPFVRATLLILVALGIAGVLGMSGSFSYAQLAGAAAAALIGTKLAALRGRYLEGLGGAAGVITLAIGSMLLLGYFFAELTPGNAVLLTLALLAAGGPLPLKNIASARWQIVLRAMACLAPLAIAIILAYRSFAAAI